MPNLSIYLQFITYFNHLHTDTEKSLTSMKPDWYINETINHFAVNIDEIIHSLTNAQYLTFTTTLMHYKWNPIKKHYE